MAEEEDRLISRFTRLNQRLQGIPSRLGDPRYKLVQVFYQGDLVNLVPDLRVLDLTEMSSSRIQALSASVEIFGNEKTILGIPRTYPEDLLANGTYIIKDMRYSLVHLYGSDMLTYQAIVKPYRSR